MRKILLLLLFALVISRPGFSQEILTDLQENPVLRNYFLKHGGEGTKGILETKALTLPFIEDFSSGGIFPRTSHWEDRNVFINNDYPVFPPTFGVATFDALNDTGAIYAEATFAPFIADYLTSRLIRLDSLFSGTPRPILKSDSLYFSFFYQPQGIANAPEVNDSLVLEFLQSPADTVISGTDTTITPAIWNHIWASEGMRLDSFQARYHVNFRQILIPVTDSTLYFRKDFRFRFYNYASLADNNIPSWRSNVDEWNLDYIVLGINRSKADTTYEDVAFVNSPQSALKRYSQMPYAQFKENPSGDMRSVFTNQITNLGRDTLIVHYGYFVLNAQGDTVGNYDGGDYNLKPYFVDGYQNFAPHALPPVNFVYPSSPVQFTTFDIVHFIEKRFAAGDTIRSNDTVRYRQEFFDYYAYDDGTPEGGYGLTPAGARLAYRFVTNKPDTLKAVNMFFNHVMNAASQKYFHLAVWNDASGKPGDLLYSSEVIKPFYAENMNVFHQYLIESATPLLVDTVFYVGWVQTTADNLNVGFDKNNNASANIFYDISGSWTNTSFTGALMIRPVLGHPTGVSLDEPVTRDPGSLLIYPNPVHSGEITLSLPAAYQSGDLAGKLSMEIYNAAGKLIYSGSCLKTFPVYSLTGGLYMVRIFDRSSGALFTNKFVVTY